jgi:hypothetical protein
VSRRRWVYTEGGQPLPEPFEVSEDWANTLPRAPVVTEELIYGGIRATDGTDISSRKKRREYMRRNGYADADDFRGEWAKAAKERERVRAGSFDKQARAEAIARAMEKRR